MLNHIIQNKKSIKHCLSIKATPQYPLFFADTEGVVFLKINKKTLKFII